MSTILALDEQSINVASIGVLCVRRKRLAAFICILLSTGLALLWSLGISSTSPGALGDFKAIFYAARCLIHHVDPYQPSRFLQVYLAEGGSIPTDPAISQSFVRAIPVCINLPSALLLVAPFVFLPWSYAAALWVLLEFLCLVLAGFLAWDLAGRLAGEKASLVSLILICLLLINSELLLSCGNLAGFVIALCVVGVWCFLQQRFVMTGVFCLAMSLAMKPHDSGFVWLCLLALQSSRRLALCSALAAGMICVPAVMLASHVAPDWLPELRSNLASTSVKGDLNDPGPSSLSGHSAASILNLQSVLSVFRDDPRIYDPMTYGICGALLLAVVILVVRARCSPQRFALAIAATVPLSLLITYHRPYDAKLLLLTVPGCALLWSRGGLIRWPAFFLQLLAIVFTGDIMLATGSILARHLYVAPNTFPLKLQLVVRDHFAPLTLFAMGIFYLFALLQDSYGSAVSYL